MPARAELKERAKTIFRANYGNSVLAFLIVSLLVGFVSYTLFGTILLAFPLELGLICFYLMMYSGGFPDLSVLFTAGFTINYARKIGGMAWMILWIFLWSLLFIIPGIIKAYSYAMTPYILAAYPDVKAKDALKLSMRIMNGHKGELFVLQLSFLGWQLLSLLTCGILEILYVGPYMNLTMVAYEYELTDYAVRSGVISGAELLGAQPVV